MGSCVSLDPHLAKARTRKSSQFATLCRQVRAELPKVGACRGLRECVNRARGHFFVLLAMLAVAVWHLKSMFMRAWCRFGSSIQGGILCWWAT
jgi:hypothetical protein